MKPLLQAQLACTKPNGRVVWRPPYRVNCDIVTEHAPGARLEPKSAYEALGTTVCCSKSQLMYCATVVRMAWGVWLVLVVLAVLALLALRRGHWKLRSSAVETPSRAPRSSRTSTHPPGPPHSPQPADMPAPQATPARTRCLHRHSRGQLLFTPQPAPALAESGKASAPEPGIGPCCKRVRGCAATLTGPRLCSPPPAPHSIAVSQPHHSSTLGLLPPTSMHPRWPARQPPD